jgi:hypothetical protein
MARETKDETVGVTSLAVHPTKSYTSIRNQLLKRRAAFQEEAAALLAPVLQEQLQLFDCDTYSKKALACSWVNHECRQFGLAVQCPVTKRPSTLNPHTDGKNSASFFRYDSVSAEGKRSYKGYTKAIREIVLVPDDPRLFSWANRISKVRRGIDDDARSR